MEACELMKRPYLDEKQAAVLTGLAVTTLRNQRHLRKGLPYLKVGARSVRYRTVDLIAYMESKVIAFDNDI